MRTKILGTILGLFFVSANSATAIAPESPEEIKNFKSVVVPHAIRSEEVTVPVIQDFDLRKDIPFPTQPDLNIEAVPIIITLTPKPSRTYSPTVADARAYALAQLGATQFECLDKLFTRESNWRTKAHNSSSGAYGIPQALPGSKMAIIADDWRTNPLTQVKWGLKYIKQRYGTACNAWRHSQNYGWY